MSKSVGSEQATGNKKRCPARNAGIASAAATAAREQERVVTAGARECSDRGIAKHWGYADHKPIGELFDPTSGAVLTLGDLYALPRELGLAIAQAIVADLGDAAPGRQCPRYTIAQLGHALNKATGKVLDDLGDNGRIDEHAQHAANFRAVEGVARRGAEAAERAAKEGAK